MVESAALVEVDGIKSLPQRLIREVFRPPAASPPACGAVIRTWVRGLNCFGRGPVRWRLAALVVPWPVAPDRGLHGHTWNNESAERAPGFN